jgi:hypothetical protein
VIAIRCRQITITALRRTAKWTAWVSKFDRNLPVIARQAAIGFVRHRARAVL